MTKKILLYGYGGAYNHGAEAILRSSISLFRQAGYPLLLSTHFPKQDQEFGLDKLVDELIPADLSIVPQEREAATFEEKEQIAGKIYRDALAKIDGNTICIGIGGDNYCYPNWHRQSIFHRTAKACGGYSALWGCSIQPEMLDQRMEHLLIEHDFISARESITYRALLEHGIKQVQLRPDPAFCLCAEPIPFPEGFQGRVIAVNLSPMLLRRSPGLMDYFKQTVRLLLKRADRLLFAHHVTMPADNDMEALELLAQQLSPLERSRICWIPGSANASQRKYLISRCEMLICCRTHASIAGYSSGVPTIVVGYSVKSQGIAGDLGMEHWTIPCERGELLPQLAVELWEARNNVRALLQQGPL